MKVFISHRSSERPFVEEVVAYFPPWLADWLDKKYLLVGDDLKGTFQKAILKECSFLIIFVSNDAAESKWVIEELKTAKQREGELSRVFVLPVLLDCGEERLEAFGLTGKKAAVVTNRNADDARTLANHLIDQISAHCAKITESCTNLAGSDGREILKTYLLSTYIALLVAGAAGGSKVMSLGPLAAGVTVLSFAFTFLITDCVNQLYGRYEAKKFILPGFVSLLLATGFMCLFVVIPPHESYKYQHEYAMILVPPFRMVIAGLVAYLIGQLCNLWIFDRLRQSTTYEQRGWRNVASTLLSQAIDTLIFVPGAFLGLHGFTAVDLFPIIAGQFLVKATVALFLSWPAFMFLTRVFRRVDFRPPIG